MLFILMLCVGMTACKNTPTPKPRGFFRMEFPTDTQRIHYQGEGLPYHFSAASFSKIERRTDEPKEQYWCDVQYPALNATLYISYKQLSQRKGEDLAARTEESYQMSYKHVVKADYISESSFSVPQHKVYGTLYEVGGDAASAIQFYATDSLRHFIRGSLYFNCTPKRDSLAPAIEFLTQDIRKIIESLQWK